MHRSPGTHARRVPSSLAASALAIVTLALLGATPVARADDATPAASPSDAAPTGGVAAPTGGAASPAPKKNPDPLEKVNRATYAFNDALDRMLARPAATAYKRVVPEPVRKAVSNVLANFEYPETIVNSALQGKLKDAGQDAARFVVNSTIGIGGLWDPATKFGIPRHDEDFGQTLGRWGVPAGPYLVLPFLGPASFRDGPSKFVDRYANASHYIGAGDTEYYIRAVGLLDTRAELLATNAALDTAFDPYGLVRNAYLQRRAYLVKDGQVEDEAYEEPFEEPVDEAAPAGTEVAPTGTDAAPTGAEAAPAGSDAPPSAGAATDTGAAPDAPAATAAAGAAPNSDVAP